MPQVIASVATPTSDNEQHNDCDNDLLDAHKLFLSLLKLTVVVTA